MKYLLSSYKDDPYSYNLLRASLLQKLIRRGMIGESLYLAQNYIESNHSKALKRKLEVIAAEDVGLGWPEAVCFIEDNKDDLLLCTSALCQAYKNREPDRFLHTVGNGLSSVRGRGQEILIESASLNKLLGLAHAWENKKDNENLGKLKEAFNKLTELAVLSDVVQKCGLSYLDLVRGKVHGADNLLALIVLLTIRKVEPSLWNPDVNNLQITPFDEMFDFALDMHTPIGKKLNRGFDHWLKEGSVVVPEINYPSLYDSHGKLKYTYK